MIGDLTVLRWSQSQPSLSYNAPMTLFSTTTPGGVCVTLSDSVDELKHCYKSWTMVMMSGHGEQSPTVRWVPERKLRLVK